VADMTRRTFDQSVKVVDEVMGLYGYGDDDIETWQAGHGLTGMMVRSPGCKVSRHSHLNRKKARCECLGPVTGVDYLQCTVLLASMLRRHPAIPEPVGTKPVMGWNHVTTWTPHADGIPLRGNGR